LLLLLLLLLINFEWPCGSDFKVDGRFSHRRNVNFTGEARVDDAEEEEEEEAGI
jgi:hypothetical protein